MNPILSHALIGTCTLIIGICIGYSIAKQGLLKLETLSQLSVAVISVLALTGLFISISQYREATTCQSSYNINFTKALQERAAASDTDRHALRIALDAILDPTADQVKKFQAIIDWRTEVQKADQSRADNPIPIIPACATKEQ